MIDREYLPYTSLQKLTKKKRNNKGCNADAGLKIRKIQVVGSLSEIYMYIYIHINIHYIDYKCKNYIRYRYENLGDTLSIYTSTFIKAVPF